MNLNFNNIFTLWQTNKTPSQIISSLIGTVLMIFAILAFAYLIYGGVLFITSQGDSGKVTTARNTIMYAIIGIVVIVISYTLLQFIGGATKPTP
jgi:uncharacterized membrane protein